MPTSTRAWGDKIGGVVHTHSVLGRLVGAGRPRRARLRHHARGLLLRPRALHARPDRGRDRACLRAQHRQGDRTRASPSATSTRWPSPPSWCATTAPSRGARTPPRRSTTPWCSRRSPRWPPAPRRCCPASRRLPVPAGQALPAQPDRAQPRDQRSQTIGLVVPNIESRFFSSLARRLELGCRERGYVLLITNSDDSADNDRPSCACSPTAGVDACSSVASTDADGEEGARPPPSRGCRCPT